jgi:diphthamide synthase (EF-2-diphthine--ammonia ligase)
MVAAGLRARITCLDPGRLSSSFCGRVFNGEFLTDLPASVDPCGERGEFHSFAYAGPMFSQAIEVEHTHNVEREGFVYGDLVLAGSSQAQ